jgi:hypothetical protein
MADVTEDLQAASDQDTAPEQHYETEDGQPYTENFSNLAENRVDQLRGLCTKFNLRDQWARQLEILRCTLKRYFWKGFQHVWWNEDAKCFQVGQNGGAVVAENMNQESTAMQDFNIYKANGKIFSSVFAQNPATVRMEPDQPGEPDSIRAAKEAEKYIRVYDKYNQPQDAQITIGRLLWNDGRVVSITEPSKDGLSETTKYVGVLESKLPIFETDFDLITYVKVSTDHDSCAMKGKYPEVADKLSNGGKAASPNDEIARMGRISTAEGITQVSHDTLQYLSTEDQWWYRTSAFYELEEEDRIFFVGGEVKQDDGTTTKEPGIFPEGCKVIFSGETFCGAKAISMDDTIAVMHAEPDEGQARNSLGDPHIPVQMEFNDGMNLAAELLKFCVPSLWADIDEVEFAAIKEQLAQYGQIRPKKSKQGEPLGNSFFPEPTVEAPVFLATWLENLQGPLTQLVTLNQPAMFGANMEDQKTAKAYQQALQQSLGVLTIVWVPYKKFTAKIHEQAAKIASQRDQPFAALVDGKNGKQDTLNIDPSVMRGGFTCSAVADQSFPESPDLKAQTWKGLKAAAATDPSIARNMDLPDNEAGFRDAIGLTDFVIQGADSRDKQLQEWADMQSGEGPEPDEQATMQRDQQNQQMAQQAVATLAPGQQPTPLPQLPPIMKSSIPIDPLADDNVAEALEMFRILNSPEGQKIKKTGNLDPPKPNAGPDDKGRPGELIWQDGKIHMMAHVAAAMAKGLIVPPPLGGAPPMPPPGGPPKPAPAAPGGAPNAPPV